MVIIVVTVVIVIAVMVVVIGSVIVVIVIITGTATTTTTTTTLFSVKRNKKHMRILPICKIRANLSEKHNDFHQFVQKEKYESSEIYENTW